MEWIGPPPRDLNMHYLKPVVLLTISNIFMTFAWYGHLKFKSSPLLIAILASWGIALLEYIFQVPANRYGHEAGISTPQLKVLQELITMIVFSVFSITYMGDRLSWNHYAAFALIVAAVFLVQLGKT